MLAVNTLQSVWVWPAPSTHLDVDPLTCLDLVTVTWRMWSWPRPARLLVHPVWHG